MFHKITKSKTLPVLGLLLLLSLAATACGGKTPGEPVTDITWQWTSLRETEPASLSITPDPENYTLILLSDGTLSIKADCNIVSGSYTIDGSAISIKLGPSTMAFCGEDSLDVQYLQLLGEVESYRLEDSQLVLELIGNAGEMVFTAE
jgi:heat shock protein HslJ